MSKYERPTLNGQRVPYKGRRFWVVEVDAQEPFGDFHDDADYLIWDGGDGGYPIALVKRLSRGRYEVATLTHVELTGIASSIRECVPVANKLLDEYMKAVS